jgi:hypothetical protein
MPAELIIGDTTGLDPTSARSSPVAIGPQLEPDNPSVAPSKPRPRTTSRRSTWRSRSTAKQQKLIESVDLRALTAAYAACR